MVTWPCDEINYIWRYGNPSFPTDEFSPEMATRKIKIFIRKKFHKLSQKLNCKYVVEKTCANSLRIAYVREIFPESKFIFLHRDGVDASISAMKRWQAKIDIPYILRKARFVPFSEAHLYALRFVRNRLHKVLSKENSLATWGPRFRGMDRIVEELELIQICGIQWSKCVLNAKRELDKIKDNDVLWVSYEEFVTNPKACLKEICKFIGIKADSLEIKNSVKKVTNKNIGKGRTVIDQDQAELLIPTIFNALEEFGYIENICET